MNIRSISRAALLTITATLIGCVQAGGERAGLVPGAKIGIVNLVGAQPRNVHVGTTIFNNFDEPYTSTFDFRGFIERELIQALTYNAAYRPEVVALTPTLNNAVGVVECSTWTGPLSDEIKSELSRIAAHQRIDMFVVAVSGCSTVGSNVKITGYGLHTHSLLALDRAYAYSSILYLRVMPDGEALLPYGAPKTAAMIPFESAVISDGQMRNLPQPELQRIDLMVQNLMRNQIYGVALLVR
ncbi:hypothetical protein [Stenotrophobium rhamnosiphilum]|uniref:Lipoprotein n=1 Tax=Stenotrophobium rhamnosiphilum TaxID=2029166 RepID=A0A2T5MBF5_9GAMM|nr:hypothetical protein [Stenotrophobium rhamnosiphilum]PTU29056.1 hypothetical protein CJD38_16990 [Stenotrophobium rhamnosiphilum]